jgi:dihydroorotate dehydrogenase electron transfer subunit
MPLTQATGTITDRRAMGAALELVVRSPEIARLLAPGQPVLVKAGPVLSPYLRRTLYPIALGAQEFTLRIPPSTDWGDAWLRVAPVGAEIDCFGPVGNGFSVESGVRNLLCVGAASDAGAGADAWSLLPLIGWADAAGLSVTFAAGAQSVRSSLPAAMLPAGVEYHLVTSDGRPDVIRPLMSTLSDLLPWADALCAVLTFDAYEPLAATIRDARYALSRGFAQAIYPSRFLCGTGACQACVAGVAGGRRRVCLRGPVFDLTDIVGRQGD